MLRPLPVGPVSTVAATVFAPAAGVPVPVSPTVSGLLAAFEAMFRVADAAPDALGVKVTLTVQDVPAATAPQLLVWAKSARFAPLSVTPLTVSVSPPVLSTVTACDALVVPVASGPNASAVLLSETSGGCICPPPP